MRYFLLLFVLCTVPFSQSLGDGEECLFSDLVAHPGNPFKTDLKVLAGWPEGMKVGGGKYLPESPDSAGRGTEGGVYDATVVVDGVRRKVIEKAYVISKESVGSDQESTLQAFQWAASEGIGPRIYGYVDVSVERTHFGQSYRVPQRLLYMEDLRRTGDNVIYSGELRGHGLILLGDLPQDLSNRVIAKWKRLQEVHPDPHELRNFHITVLRNPPKDDPNILRHTNEKGEVLGVDIRAVDWRVSHLGELEQIRRDWEQGGEP